MFNDLFKDETRMHPRALKLQRNCHKWRTTAVAYAENFHGGGLVQGHMVVICIWCALFVTSQYDVISLFPNQRFGEVC